MADVADLDRSNHFLDQLQVDIGNGYSGGGAIAGHCDGHIGLGITFISHGAEPDFAGFGALYGRVGRHGSAEPDPVHILSGDEGALSIHFVDQYNRRYRWHLTQYAYSINAMALHVVNYP